MSVGSFDSKGQKVKKSRSQQAVEVATLVEVRLLVS